MKLCSIMNYEIMYGLCEIIYKLNNLIAVFF